jgi:hypothetical protein
MTTQQPPIIEALTEEDGKARLPWTLFFNQMYQGDLGDVWNPDFTSLTEVGGDATINGRYYQITKGLAFFRIDVIPATNTSATAGTTYIDNFPLQINANGVCMSVSGNLGGSLGIVSADDSRIYAPTWTTVTDTVTILGIVEAS